VGDLLDPGASRRAVARSRVTMLPATAAAVTTNELKKGDVLATARFAGIQATRSASALLPLTPASSHLDVTVSFEVGDAWIDVEATVVAHDRSRVETQALTAAAVASLTIYDMCKSMDHSMVVVDLGVIH